MNQIWFKPHEVANSCSNFDPFTCEQANSGEILSLTGQIENISKKENRLNA